MNGDRERMQARLVTQDNGDAAGFPLMHRLWLLYPFMHSEKLAHLQVSHMLPQYHLMLQLNNSI